MTGAHTPLCEIVQPNSKKSPSRTALLVRLFVHFKRPSATTYCTDGIADSNVISVYYLILNINIIIVRVT